MTTSPFSIAIFIALIIFLQFIPTFTFVSICLHVFITLFPLRYKRSVLVTGIWIFSPFPQFVYSTNLVYSPHFGGTQSRKHIFGRRDVVELVRFHPELINVLAADALNAVCLRLCGLGHMLKDHSDRKRGNLMPPSWDILTDYHMNDLPDSIVHTSEGGLRCYGIWNFP